MKVAWTHNFEDEPIEMWSELDPNGMELRKVERLRNGTLTFAGPIGASGETRLGETPLSALAVIDQDPQFTSSLIGQDEFEQAWRTAIGRRSRLISLQP